MSSLQPILEDGKTFWVIADFTRSATGTTADDDFYFWIQNQMDTQFWCTSKQFNFAMTGKAGG